MIKKIALLCITVLSVGVLHSMDSSQEKLKDSVKNAYQEFQPRIEYLYRKQAEVQKKKRDLEQQRRDIFSSKKPEQEKINCKKELLGQEWALDKKIFNLKSAIADQEQALSNQMHTIYQHLIWGMVDTCIDNDLEADDMPKEEDINKFSKFFNQLKTKYDSEILGKKS